MPLLLILAQVDEEKRAADSKVTYDIGNIQKHVGRGDRGGAGVGFLGSEPCSHPLLPTLAAGVLLDLDLQTFRLRRQRGQPHP